MKRSRQKYAVALGLVWAICGSAMAEEKTAQLGEMVVTATRDEVPIEQVGSSITVITAKELEQQQQRTVADALRMVPGLDVVRTGSYGGTTSVFMRGAKSEHTLVLIDGIEMNDPSSTGGGYNFANLTTDNIERIEILRGPQSTLYGSHAIGGVINIITKRGDGNLKGFLSVEGGSLYTARESAGVSGGTDLLQYALTVSRLDTNGVSAAGEKYGNTERDGYQNSTLATRLGITPTKNSEIDLILRYDHTRTSLDNGGGKGMDDPNRVMKSDDLFFRTQGWLSLFDGLWEQKLGVSFADLSWRDDNDNDNIHPNDLLRSSFHGQSTKLDWQHTLKLHKTTTLMVGVETTEENAKSDYYSLSKYGPYTSTWDKQYARTTGVYLQDQLSLWDAWFSTLGVRVDNHSKFGTEATYRFTTAYLIKQTDTKLKGSYGTGFKAPSLYQLYSSYGSPDLQPDKSIGWDIGMEQGLPFLKTTLGATWFRNQYSQMIDFDMDTWKYTNIAKAHTQGLELTAALQPLDQLTLKTAYTYMETKDDITGKQLVRRPKNKVAFDANYSFLKKANANMGLVYVGTRYADAANTNKMGDYLLVNLALSYDVTKNLQLFGRIDNLFDRQYEEVAGYGTPGIGGYGGVKVSF
jgi:vitamin B12 transporter